MNGHVDGAWWPHSDDLAVELPELLAELAVRLGRIDCVKYNVNEWTTAPTELATDGRMVRLDGHRRQPANTIEVLGLGRGRIVVLVVPPHTESDQAHTTMVAATGPDNASTVDGLLGINARDREVRSRAAAAQHRWESAGRAD